LALVAPILALVLIASPQIQSRVDLAITETLAYQPGNTTPSSVGARLNFWNRSIQAIAERPWTGFGAGSWGMQYKRLDAGADPWYKGSGGNPHQEFLLWGVLLGVGGIGLLCSLLASLWRDASRLASPHERAMKSVILVLVTTAMFNCVLYDGEIGDYFCLMLGLLLALGRAATAKGSEAIASPTGGAA
jgi:O-antigen ligase